MGWKLCEVPWEICIIELWEWSLDMEENNGINEGLGLSQEMCIHCSVTMDLIKYFLIMKRLTAVRSENLFTPS